jgi:hypothetical protein
MSKNEEEEKKRKEKKSWQTFRKLLVLEKIFYIFDLSESL